MLRAPLPTTLNYNLAIHSNDSFWTVQKDQASLSAVLPTTPRRPVQAGRLHRGDDGLSNLVLHGEHIDKTAVVAFRPDMAAGGSIIKLRRDAHAVAAFAHAALEHVTDAELFGDLLHVDGLTLVDK